MWITFQFENTRRNESTERYSGGSTKLKSITKQLARKGGEVQTRPGTEQGWYSRQQRGLNIRLKNSNFACKDELGILSCFLSDPIFLSLIIWFYNPVLGHCLFSENNWQYISHDYRWGWLILSSYYYNISEMAKQMIPSDFLIVYLSFSELFFSYTFSKYSR